MKMELDSFVCQDNTVVQFDNAEERQGKENKHDDSHHNYTSKPVIRLGRIDTCINKHPEGQKKQQDEQCTGDLHQAANSINIIHTP